MTRASEERLPSSDLITRDSFARQRPLVTTRAPRLLMFSVNVSSVGNGASGLVSITATVTAFRFSYRPVCMAIGLGPYLMHGHRIRCGKARCAHVFAMGSLDT